MTCITRYAMGQNYSFSWFVSGVVAGRVAIAIEEKSKRHELALYTFQMGLISLVQSALSKGWIRAIPNFDVFVYAISISILLYLDRESSSVLSQSTRFSLKVIFGELDYSKKDFLLKYFIKNSSTPNGLCSHPDNCEYFSFLVSLRGFLFGYGMRSLTKIVPWLFQKRKKSFFSNFGEIPLKTGIFFALLSGGYRFLLCLLTRLSKKQKNYHTLIAGFIAGLSFGFLRSVDLAVYCGIRAMESLLKFVAEKYEWKLKRRDESLFSLNMGILFWFALFEPHNLPKGFWDMMILSSAGRYRHLDKLYNQAERAVH